MLTIRPARRSDVDALLEALEWAREAVDNGFVDERAASA